MEKVVMLRSSCAIASNRCSRRALMSTAVSSWVPSTPRACPGRSCRSRRFFAWFVTRRMRRTSSHQMMNETTIVSTMMIAFLVIQSPTACQKVWLVDVVVELAVTASRLLSMVEA
jgi:hypothetical protein